MPVHVHSMGEKGADPAHNREWRHRRHLWKRRDPLVRAKPETEEGKQALERVLKRQTEEPQPALSSFGTTPEPESSRLQLWLCALSAFDNLFLRGRMQHECEHAAAIRIVFDPDISLMGFNNRLAD